MILITILVLPHYYSWSGYARVLCNYGTIPLNATLHYAACGDDTRTIKILKENNNQCVLIDSGGCCLTGITLSDPQGSYQSLYCPTDNFDKRPDLHIMEGTGLGMACADTKLSFWNDLSTHTLETTATTYAKAQMAAITSALQQSPLFKNLFPKK